MDEEEDVSAFINIKKNLKCQKGSISNTFSAITSRTKRLAAGVASTLLRTLLIDSGGRAH